MVFDIVPKEVLRFLFLGKKMSDCNLESSVFVRKLGGDAPNYTY